MDWDRLRRPHLIGIGGIGVSGVARALHARGLDVRGTDVRESSITRALRREGIRVTIGQRAENLSDADAVIVSTAIPETNPELRAAVDRGLTILHRSEVLGALMTDRPSFGVMGTHGKGTVASFVSWLLDRAGLDPSFIIGGLLLNWGTNARYREDGWLVAEVDESDGSLVNVPTRAVLLNNLEADHLNYYKNGLDDVIDTFVDYFERHPGVEHIFGNADDEGVRETMRRVDRPWIRYGVECGEVDYRAVEVTVDGLTSRFTVLHEDAPIGHVRLRLPGRYNINNAIGAIAAAHSLGVPFEAIEEGVESFLGLENRFTVVEVGGVRVVKDYISHPTGIRRVLDAAQESDGGPIIAVFKPYRFTMVNYLLDDYATAFRDAAHTVITELYPAGEVPIPGIDTEVLCERVRATGSAVTYVPAMDAIVPFLLDNVSSHSQVLFFGGDDLFELADRYIAQLAERDGGKPA